MSPLNEGFLREKEKKTKNRVIVPPQRRREKRKFRKAREKVRIRERRASQKNLRNQKSLTSPLTQAMNLKIVKSHLMTPRYLPIHMKNLNSLLLSIFFSTLLTR